MTMDDPRPTSPLDVITVRERLVVDGVGELTIQSVKQRNWSRVGRAESADGTRYFVKQFADRIGGRHDKGFRGETDFVASLPDTLVDGLRVVPVLGRVDERLLLVAPFIEMSTIDSISQALPRHAAPAGQVGRALRSILDERTISHDPPEVAVWKGLDPKNIGWTKSGELWVFDFGPATVLPVSAAAARVVAAGLLSRWVARPGSHLVWPERSILRAVCEPIADLTDLAAVEAELGKQARLRQQEPQRVGLAGLATQVGLRTVGRVHWAVVEREARRLFASR